MPALAPAPVMLTAATKLAAVRVLVTPEPEAEPMLAMKPSERRGGAGRCVLPTHIAGRTPRRETLALLRAFVFRSRSNGCVGGRGGRDCRWTRLTESKAECSPGVLDSTEPGQKSARCAVLEHLQPPDRGTRVDE